MQWHTEQQINWHLYGEHRTLFPINFTILINDFQFIGCGIQNVNANIVENKHQWIANMYLIENKIGFRTKEKTMPQRMLTSGLKQNRREKNIFQTRNQSGNIN